MIPFAWQLGIAAVLTVGAWLHGRHFGSEQVQSEWDSAEVDRERAIQAQEASARRQANIASTRYETLRAKLQSESNARQELKDSLSKPICEDSNALQLADLPIPVAAVDRLRRASGKTGD